MKKTNNIPYKLLYEINVRSDVRKAKTWYKKQNHSLETHFALEIKSAISRLSTNPYACTIRYKNIRFIYTHTFPFGIHFYINEANSEIIIAAIMHDYRDVILNGE